MPEPNHHRRADHIQYEFGGRPSFHPRRAGDDLRPGDLCVARTVFRGTEIEEFDIEIPEEDAEKIVSVQDAVNYLSSRISS